MVQAGPLPPIPPALPAPPGSEDAPIVQKFRIAGPGRLRFYLRAGERLTPIRLDVDDGCMSLYAIVDPGELPAWRHHFRLVGTGEPCPIPSEGDYIDSARLDGVMWHLFTDKTSSTL